MSKFSSVGILLDMRKALVSGSGIAGLTAAYWLAKDGWQVTVVEKAKAERTDGYMMDFYGNGWDVAEKMGLTQKIKGMHYPIDALQIVGSQGNSYFSVPIQRLINALDNKYRPIRRPDLEHILLESVSTLPVTIHYDTTVTDLECTPQQVHAKLSHGKEQTFDIVVGADGVHSQVRKLAFGEEKEFGHYLGYILSFFHTKRDTSIGNNMCLYQEPNRQFGMYPYSDDEMDVLYIFRTQEHERMRQEDYKSFLLKAVKGMGWKAEEILENTPEEKITFLDTTEQIRMPKWHKDRVVLVGDAAACPTLTAGQGSSMAMTESYVLAKKLAEHKEVEEAFEAYEAELFQYVLDLQTKAEKFAKNFVPDTRFGVLTQRWLMRVALSPLFAKRAMSSFTGRRIV